MTKLSLLFSQTRYMLMEYHFYLCNSVDYWRWRRDLSRVLERSNKKSLWNLHICVAISNSVIALRQVEHFISSYIHKPNKQNGVCNWSNWSKKNCFIKVSLILFSNYVTILKSFHFSGYSYIRVIYTLNRHLNSRAQFRHNAK